MTLRRSGLRGGLARRAPERQRAFFGQHGADAFFLFEFFDFGFGHDDDLGGICCSLLEDAKSQAASTKPLADLVQVTCFQKFE